MRLEVSNSSSTVAPQQSWYHEIFYERADPRIRDRWLMGDPVQLLLIYSFYIVLIKHLLPRFMRDRKPLDVDQPVIVLNIVIFFVNLYFVAEAFVPWLFLFSWRCQPVDWTDSELGMKAVDITYLFLLSKFIYTLESVFLGLKKNTSYRATYLLIHHSSFPLIVWMIANYFPGGHATFPGFINSLQHMLLFGYRLIFVDIYPDLSKRMFKLRKPIGLWLSLLQFLFIFVHTFQLFFWNDCGFPMAYVYGILIYTTFITVLLMIMVVPHM